MKSLKLLGLSAIVAVTALTGCKPKGTETAVSGDAAQKVYVAPGKYDEFYNFVSGGFNGQVNVYGLPSGRLLKVLPVFSVNPENGYGYSEETNLCSKLLTGLFHGMTSTTFPFHKLMRKWTEDGFLPTQTILRAWQGSI